MVKFVLRGVGGSLIRSRGLKDWGEGQRGECQRKKGEWVIRVRKDLEGEEELEVLLHEFMHAAYWDHDEEFVEEVAADLAKLLWRLGYRKG